MKNKEKQGFTAGIGIPTILMIFVVLCLTTFGVLALTSANSDSKLTGRAQSAMQAYYEADAAAQHKLAQIDAALHSNSSLPAGVMKAGELLSFQIPLSDGRTLSVVLRLTDGQTRYVLDEYRVLPEEDEAEDGTINVWPGE